MCVVELGWFAGVVLLCGSIASLVCGVVLLCGRILMCGSIAGMVCGSMVCGSMVCGGMVCGSMLFGGSMLCGSIAGLLCVAGLLCGSIASRRGRISASSCSSGRNCCSCSCGQMSGRKDCSGFFRCALLCGSSLLCGSMIANRRVEVSCVRGGSVSSFPAIIYNYLLKKNHVLDEGVIPPLTRLSSCVNTAFPQLVRWVVHPVRVCARQREQT